ncbi:unnamed protein product [Angiostrongylus costaricensis]|uniref:Hsp90 chaperone protein kinase-targeting subunit n=1 Tax=Angiostrongylus costaricensis TaxID=334426 RepID=A0A158PG49_ANGCS|nr:unnamed protein product [Angiostrongylus costaricensis]
MPIDYSKWKEIEVSDDEDDTHPNIDTPSLFRQAFLETIQSQGTAHVQWRHQARLERMAEKKQKKEEIEKNKSTSNSKIEAILIYTLYTLKASLIVTSPEVMTWQDLEQERLEPWNVDTIGHEAFSSSRINKVGEKKPPPKISDEEDTKRMTNFFDQNESLIQEYGKLNSLEESEEFILEHPHLASEYTANYLTIDALNLAIEHKEAEMSNIARQCIIIQYLLELAKNMNAIPTNVNIIKAFFKKFRSADPQYLKLYTDEVAAFEERLIRRAKEKRDAALAEYEAEEKEKRIAAAPGGLDPQEVYESLPEEMRAAFDSQEVSKLQEVALTMDREVCISFFRLFVCFPPFF